MQKVAINKKNAKQEIMIKVIRNNRSITLRDKIGNDVLLGVGGGLMTYKKVSFVDAIKLSLHEVLSLTKMTYVGLWNAVVHKQTKSIGGPVMIAKESARAGKQGICMFAYFIALISISLGAINLIPIPLLDGGHILFSAIEGITRKRLPNIVYKIALYLGIGVLSLLMGLGFLNDLFLR
jgi:regulator of sigma E protease